MKRFARLLLLSLLGPLQLAAALFSGSVRAADRFIPGATVTARQGTVKLIAYTDEDGRYSIELTPGTWEIQVEMLGFITQLARVAGDNDSCLLYTSPSPRD